MRAFAWALGCSDDLNAIDLHIDVLRHANNQIGSDRLPWLNQFMPRLIDNHSGVLTVAEAKLALPELAYLRKEAFTYPVLIEEETGEEFNRRLRCMGGV
jgi:hypothetical protein